MQPSRAKRDSSSSPNAYADRVWLRFAEMFGARFGEQYGSAPNESWRDAIGELRWDQIKGALSKVRYSGSPHPPSLPEFVALARNTPAPRPQSAPSETRLDPWVCLGNRALFQYLKTKGGASEKSLLKLIEAKNQIIAVADDTSKPEEVRDVLYAAFDKVCEEMPTHRVEWHMEHYARTGRVHDAFA